jgi:type II secretory pathway component GspD/PulD (secretin)
VTGLRFVADKELANERVSGIVQTQDAETGIISFLRANGYFLFRLPESWAVRPGQATRSLIWTDDKGSFYLDITNGEIGAMARELASRAGVSLVVYPYVRGNISSMQLYGVSLDEALKAILRGSTYTYLKQGDTYYIGEGLSPRPDSPDLSTSKMLRLKYLQATDVIAMLPPSLPAQALKTVPGQNAVLVTGSADLLAAFETFISAVDTPQPSPAMVVIPIRYVKPEDLTSGLTRLFPQQSVQYLQGQNSLLVNGSDDLVNRVKSYVSTMDAPELAIKTEVLRLQHIQAEEAKQLLPTVYDASRIIVVPDQNALSVTARSDILESLRSYLTSIDVRNPQIVFDVMVMEISDRQNSQLGISAASSDGAMKVDLLSGSPFSLTFGLGPAAGAQLKATLSALAQEGKAKVLANPRLATLNGKEATFNIVTTSRYWEPQTVVNPGQSGGTGNTGGSGPNGSGSTTVTTVAGFRSIETGIRLRLKPWVSAAGDITIDLQPEISDSAGSSAGSSLPQTNDRSVHTMVRVKDGETIVIGGLKQRTEHVDTTKVPLLGDLPILGRLFQSNRKAYTETEFVIAITSNLVKEDLE